MTPVVGGVRHMYEAAVARMPDARVRWRVLGALFAAGGSLALISLLLPHPPEVDEPLLALVAGSALVAGTAMLAGPTPRGDGWVLGFLCVGSGLISLAVWASHDLDSPYAFFYVWVALHGCSFLGRRAAAASVAAAGVGYAAALAAVHDPQPGGGGRWMITMGTVLVVGLVAALLRERSERLILQLGDAARTDPLTGLLNRRGFQQVLEERSGTRLALIIADLDHFKALNDRFGHHEGDEVLTRCGALLASAIPPGAAAARIGGEEFAVVLPGADARAAVAQAESLRRLVRERISPGGRLLTMSLGIAATPEHADTIEDLLRAADKALYFAKQLGRDRSVVFSAEVHAAGELRPRDVALGEQAAAVIVLAEAIDMRDGGTAAHSRNVGRFAEITARGLGFSEERVERIRLAGVLHDVGKIGVPDQILRKPDRLTDGEWGEITRHPELGARILVGAGLDDIAGWVLAHHERLDGTGYPYGLAGADIPVEARILAVANAYEAMTSDRSYRPACSHEKAAAELVRRSGRQFDGEVVQALLAGLSIPTPPAAAEDSAPLSDNALRG